MFFFDVLQLQRMTLMCGRGEQKNTNAGGTFTSRNDDTILQTALIVHRECVHQFVAKPLSSVPSDAPRLWLFGVNSVL